MKYGSFYIGNTDLSYSSFLALSLAKISGKLFINDFLFCQQVLNRKGRLIPANSRD